MKLWVIVFVCAFTLRLADSTSPIILTDDYGKISSPGYPSPYANNLDVEWDITVKPGHVIAMKFSNFVVEDSYEEDIGSCVYDYVKITDDDNTVIANLCGNATKHDYDAPNSGKWFKSKTNKIKVKFVSDYSNEAKFNGFQAHYKMEDVDNCRALKQKAEAMEEDWDQLLYCSQQCHNTPGSYYCSCNIGYTLHENKHTCTPNCEDMKLTGDTGEIYTPEYPNQYPKLSNCKWTIDVGVGKSINLNFASPFKIESHFEEGCVYDYIEIAFDGETKRYCGETSPNDPKLKKTQSNKVEIRFVSDLSVEKSGFKFNYSTTRASCDDGLLPIKDGIIKSGRKSKYEYEDEVEFSCSTGYELEGNSRIKCMHNGKWNIKQPICKIVSCGDPQHKDIPNSHILDFDTKKWTYGETFTIGCNKWYEMVSGNNMWRCESDKTWKSMGQPIAPNTNNNLPECKPECGISGKTPAFTSFLSGGAETHPHEFPWMTLLSFNQQRIYIFPTTFLSICGASVITPTFVLTAAHCVVAKNGVVRAPSEIHAWMGVHNRKNDQDDRKNVIYSGVTDVIQHEDYNKLKWNYDIAVLKLAVTIVMSDNVRPICLPSIENEFSLVDKITTKGQLAGWGLYQSSATSEALMEAEFTVQPDKEKCWDDSIKTIQALSVGNFEVPKKSYLTENMFCAGDKGAKVTNACGGDSGGPFMVKRALQPGSKVAKYMVLGLVSFGITDEACATHPAYTVYTRLNVKLTDWIKQKVNF